MRAVVLSHTYINPEDRGKLRALAGLGCSIALAVPDHWVHPITGSRLAASWGDDGGVRVVPVRVRGAGGGPELATWDRSTLKKLLRDFRPDILQVEEDPWTPAAASVSAVAARLRIPVVLFSAESVTRAYPFRQRLRRRSAVNRAAGFLGGNRLAAALLSRGRPSLPVEVIPQLGAPIPRRLTPVPHDGFTIGFVGRLVHEKGCDLLLRACVQVLGAWNLIVVGSGPAQEEMESLAERLGIASRVTWLGALPREELAAAWPRFDCLVLPARTTQRWVEPHGRAVIEAMAHSVTVIGSTSGALPEIIGDAGLVIPEDDVRALTAAVQDLRDSAPRRQAFALEGRRRVMAEFVDGALARKTLAFWEKVRASR